MTVQVDIWLRGTDVATTETIEDIAREPGAWMDDDVRVVLEGMLHAMDRAKNPNQPKRVASLRGFSWIVNPFESGGVVIALEMTLGAVVAGPFDVPESALTGMIQRAIDDDKLKTGSVENSNGKLQVH